MKIWKQRFCFDLLLANHEYITQFFFNIIFEDNYYFEVVLVQCQNYKIRTAVLSPFFYVTWQDIIYP